MKWHVGLLVAIVTVAVETVAVETVVSVMDGTLWTSVSATVRRRRGPTPATLAQTPTTFVDWTCVAVSCDSVM